MASCSWMVFWEGEVALAVAVVVVVWTRSRLTSGSVGVRGVEWELWEWCVGMEGGCLGNFGVRERRELVVLGRMSAGGAREALDVGGEVA